MSCWSCLFRIRKHIILGDSIQCPFNIVFLLGGNKTGVSHTPRSSRKMNILLGLPDNGIYLLQDLRDYQFVNLVIPIKRNVTLVMFLNMINPWLSYSWNDWITALIRTVKQPPVLQKTLLLRIPYSLSRRAPFDYNLFSVDMYHLNNALSFMWRHGCVVEFESNIIMITVLARAVAHITGQCVSNAPLSVPGVNGTITSPNYPNYYPNMASCMWRIQSSMPTGVSNDHSLHSLLHYPLCRFSGFLTRQCSSSHIPFFHYLTTFNLKTFQRISVTKVTCTDKFTF